MWAVISWHLRSVCHGNLESLGWLYKGKWNVSCSPYKPAVHVSHRPGLIENHFCMFGFLQCQEHMTQPYWILPSLHTCGPPLCLLGLPLVDTITALPWSMPCLTLQDQVCSLDCPGLKDGTIPKLGQKQGVFAQHKLKWWNNQNGKRYAWIFSSFLKFGALCCYTDYIWKSFFVRIYCPDFLTVNKFWWCLFQWGQTHIPHKT